MNNKFWPVEGDRWLRHVEDNRYELLSMTGLHLAYLRAEHVEMPSTLRGEILKPVKPAHIS